MADQQRRSGVGGIGDGIRAGLGILSAFKEAVEETLQEAVDRGDLSPERAKRALRDTVERLQGSLEETKERLDLVPRKEFDELRDEVERLRGRIERMEARAGGGVPDATGAPGAPDVAAG